MAGTIELSKSRKITVIKVSNNIVEFGKDLPAWWEGGAEVRIIHKENNFFIYRMDKSRLQPHYIGENKNLELEDAPDGWYEVLVHSEACISLNWNRSLDNEPPQEKEKIKPIDPRTATETDLNYWLFVKARDMVESGHITKGFADAVKVMRDAFNAIKTETKSLQNRKTKIKEILVEEENTDDED